jgi:hypothetical protein
MVNVGIWRGREPVPFPAIGAEVLQHVFMDLFLQVHAHGAVRPNDFVRTDSRVGRNITARIRQSHISGIISDGVSSPLGRGHNQSLKKFLARVRFERCYLRWYGRELHY